MTLPLAPSPVASPPAPVLPHRRRGGQPANCKAYRHGMYSACNPSSLAAISATLDSIAIERRLSPRTALRHIPTLQYMVSEGFQPTQDRRLLLTQMRLVVKLTGFSAALKKDKYLLFEREDIRLVAAAASSFPLIEGLFLKFGVPRDTDSFREKLDKSDLKSAHQLGTSQPFLEEPLYSYIPECQWAVIEPLLPPREKTTRRGRPPADPRPLLGAIFWKFSHAARWQDLPASCPPMLTCQRYYRRLSLSGCLFNIYYRLYMDFLQHPGLDLPTLVEKGVFYIVDHKVTIRSGLPGTWYLRTALLFLQLAYQVYHLVDDKFMLEWHRCFALPCMPSPHGR